MTKTLAALDTISTPGTRFSVDNTPVYVMATVEYNETADAVRIWYHVPDEYPRHTFQMIVTDIANRAFYVHS